MAGPLCSGGGDAGSAPRTAPAFVLVRTPSTSTAGPRPRAHSPASQRTCFGKRKKERRTEGGSFPIVSPLRPNSALIPSPGIRAADFNSVSRGTSLLPTRCWGPGSPGGEFLIGIRFAVTALGPSRPGSVPRQRLG